MHDEDLTNWVSAATAAAYLSTHEKRIRRLAETGHIAVRKLPGCRARYSSHDIRRLLEVSTRPRTALPPEAPACR